jgi:serine protease
MNQTELTLARLTVAAAVISACFLAFHYPSAPAAPPYVPASAEWIVPGEIVVDLKDDVVEREAGSLWRQMSLAPTGMPPAGLPGKVFRARLAPGADMEATLRALRRDPRVEAAEPEHLVKALWKPNDPRYKDQWHLHRIGMEKAWEITKGRGAVVAVIDTGVAFETDDKCYRCRDFDRTRFVDPYDFTSRDRHPHDDNGHGTHVAGTIAESTDNGEGAAGIAFEASVMPIKVLRADGSGRMSDVAAGIRYAADKGAHIINMSLGAPFGDSVTKSAVQYAAKKGVTIICAAGNSGGEGVGYPAAYPECIAVSATGPTGTLAPYSSYGAQVAIAAPGGDKQRGEQFGVLQNTYFAGGGAQVDDYFYFQGTSMATPHVAGVAALIVSLGEKDPAQIRHILQKSATPKSDRKRYGAGELNAERAVALAKSSSADYSAKWLLASAVWAFAGVVALLRKRTGSRYMPWGSAFAVSLGLFLPDAVTMAAGQSSLWNIVGHSCILPALLVVSSSLPRRDLRFFGAMCAGLALHLLMDLWHGSAPFLPVLTGSELPWLWTNIIAGAMALYASMRR